MKNAIPGQWEVHGLDIADCTPVRLLVGSTSSSEALKIARQDLADEDRFFLTTPIPAAINDPQWGEIEQQFPSMSRRVLRDLLVKHSLQPKDMILARLRDSDPEEKNILRGILRLREVHCIQEPHSMRPPWVTPSDMQTPEDEGQERD